MIDRYTKIVLTVIAVALTMLALQPFYAPRPAQADAHHLSGIYAFVHNIDAYVQEIAQGICTNDKIC
jgi:hypothetical protein